jgi:glycosyltransferase involved in cell wall biosynthesis
MADAPAPADRAPADGATPRVSMVMPVYNGARYLGAALQSVLAQTFADFELICIDDGSQDETAAILARHAAADTRVRHLTNVRNIGLPATLNRGFGEARGAYHSWTSHDNLLRPDMLSVLVGALDRDAGADIVYGAYTVIDADGVVLRRVDPKPPEQRWFGNVVGAAFLYRAAVTQALGGYDEALFGAEDYDFWLRAARQFTLRPVMQDLYLYRRHEASLTDQRMAAIKAMVASVVQRELALTGDPKLSARALLKLVLDDGRQLRTGLLLKAASADAGITIAALPALAKHGARILWNRLRG